MSREKILPPRSETQSVRKPSQSDDLLLMDFQQPGHHVSAPIDQSDRPPLPLSQVVRPQTTAVASAAADALETMAAAYDSSLSDEDQGEDEDAGGMLSDEAATQGCRRRKETQGVSQL